MQELFKEKAVRCYELNSGRKSSYPLSYSWETDLRTGTPGIKYSDYYIFNKPRGSRSFYKSFNSVQDSSKLFSYRGSANKKNTSSSRSNMSTKNPFYSKSFEKSSVDRKYTPLKISNTLIARKMFELDLANRKFSVFYNHSASGSSSRKAEEKEVQEKTGRMGFYSKKKSDCSSDLFVDENLRDKDKCCLPNNHTTFSDSQFGLTEMETKDEMFTQ